MDHTKAVTCALLIGMMAVITVNGASANVEPTPRAPFCWKDQCNGCYRADRSAYQRRVGEQLTELDSLHEGYGGAGCG